MDDRIGGLDLVHIPFYLFVQFSFRSKEMVGGDMEGRVEEGREKEAGWVRMTRLEKERNVSLETAGLAWGLPSSGWNFVMLGRNFIEDEEVVYCDDMGGGGIVLFAEVSEGASVNSELRSDEVGTHSETEGWVTSRRGDMDGEEMGRVAWWDGDPGEDDLEVMKMGARIDEARTGSDRMN
ncbi:hypothetical protein Tco_0640150 [Tanacetum coccineum]